MGRIFFFIALAVLIYLGIVLARRRRIQNVARRTRREQEGGQALPMIRCPVCGTHFPADEAVMGKGVRYCSEKCRDKVRAGMEG